MKEFRCKTLKPGEIIEIEHPNDHFRFIVPDDEMVDRVEDAYYSCVLCMWTEDNGVFTSDVKIACYDDSGMRSATLWIDEKRGEWVQFNPGDDFVPCSRSTMRALVGNATWCRIRFRNPRESTVACTVDVVGQWYYDEYARVWG